MSFQYISDKNPLILASASPRRKELLEQVKIPFIVVPSHIDENGEKGEPCDICSGLAEKKALSLYSPSNGNWILGADTIVVKNGIIMGKPMDAGEARYMLENLSNGDHEVVTGFSIVDPSGCIARTSYVSTTVRFKKLTCDEIDSYVKTKEPFGKAGAYAIQGFAAQWITRLEGSYSGVMGLPLFETMELLRQAGIRAVPGVHVN